MAFKLVHAALLEGKKRNRPAFTAIPDGWEKWLLDLVAIATVADLVPLVGENRVLCRFGLRVLRKSPRSGILALCAALRLRREEISEDDIAFSIAPRINAASRMDEPRLALRLLTTRDQDEAEQLARTLEALNTKRKGVVAGIVRSAKKSVTERYRTDEKVVVLGNPDWKPALLGLAANSIMEDRGGVVCMWGRDAEGRLKGSCRSDGSVSVVELFAKSGALIEFGGHEKSGGFTVSAESVHTLPDVLAAAAGSIVKNAQVEARAHDAIISLREVSWPLFEEISRIGPFGIGNPKPVFRVSDVLVTEVRRFGKEKNHIELQIECRRTGSRARAFDFFRSPEDFTLVPAQGASAALAATLERDTYRRALALRIADVLPL
jgi:single-stranded-DNA-specific exonuclease